MSKEAEQTASFLARESGKFKFTIVWNLEYEHKNLHKTGQASKTFYFVLLSNGDLNHFGSIELSSQ